MDTSDNEQMKKTAEQSLRQSEERLRNFMVASNNLVYRMNADWTKMENLVGRAFLADTDAPTDGWVEKYLLVEDRAYILSEIHHAINTKSVFDLEHRVRQADGSVGWVHSRAVPLLNEHNEIVEWIGAGTDITEKHKAENALRESEEKYRSLFNSIDEGFCIFELIYDQQGQAVDWIYTEANPAFERQTGYIDPIGKKISYFQPNLEQSWFEKFAEVARSGHPVRFIQYTEAMGIWYDVYAMPVGTQDSNRVSLLFSDITERKRRDANIEFLSEVSEELAKLRDIDETMTTLGEKLAAHFDLSALALAELIDNAQIGVISHGWHRSDMPSLLGTYRMEEFVSPEILKSCQAGEAVIIRDVFADPRTDGEQYAALNIGSFVSMPLVRNGEWRFLLVVYRSAPYNWRDDQIELLRELTARIWSRLERARAEEALRNSEGQLRAIIEHLPSGAAFILDRSMRYTIVGGEALTSTGFTGSNFIGKTPAEVLPQEAEEQLTNYERALKGEPFTHEHQVGDHTFVTRGIPLRNAEGQVYAALAVSYDITERKYLEQIKDEFMNIASHELKTPVTAIKAFAEILQDSFEEAHDPENAALMRKMNSQIDRLVQLIKDLLDTTQLSEGQLLLHLQEVDLGELILERVEDLQRISPKHKITIDLCSVPKIRADQERINQVLTNLISNAIKYSPRGGQVHIDCTDNGREIQVRVQDQGIGISKEVREKVFDRFFRAGDTQVQNLSGMGLGLYITAGIVHRHGGRIWVESEPGKGSTFYFTLPL